MPDLLDPIRKAVKGRHSRRLEESLPLLGDDLELWLSYLAQPYPWLDAETTLYYQSVFLQLSAVLAREVLRAQNEATKKRAPGWLLALTQKWCELRSAVITLNYDTMLEKMYWAAAHVPFHVLYQIPILDVEGRRGRSTYVGYTDDCYRLFKLHGSVDWYYSGTNGRDETIYHGHFSLDWAPEPLREISNRVGGLVPMLVPPVSAKDAYFRNDRLREQWLLAARAAAEARRLFLIGYSFPPADQMMRLFLATSPHVSEVYVVNTSVEAAERAEQYMPGRTIHRSYCKAGNPIHEFVNDYVAGRV
jgi:hypothetical protein